MLKVAVYYYYLLLCTIIISGGLIFFMGFEICSKDPRADSSVRVVICAAEEKIGLFVFVSQLCIHKRNFSVSYHWPLSIIIVENE